MDDLARVSDAAKVAAKAAHPTDILVTRSGFLVIARNGNLSNARPVSFDDVQLALLNPLVGAVHDTNRAVQIDADFTVSETRSDFREG